MVNTYLEAVRGRLMEQKSRSETHRLMTKAVVAWIRSLTLLLRAMMVTRLPAIPRRETISGGWEIYHLLSILVDL